MKIGDIVVVNDLSGSLSLRPSESPCSLFGLEYCSCEWEVVAMNCFLPMGKPTSQEKNDLVLRQVTAPEHVIFIQEKFCEVAERSDDEVKPMKIVVFSSEDEVIVTTGQNELATHKLYFEEGGRDITEFNRDETLDVAVLIKNNLQVR